MTDISDAAVDLVDDVLSLDKLDVSDEVKELAVEAFKLIIAVILSSDATDTIKENINNIVEYVKATIKGMFSDLSDDEIEAKISETSAALDEIKARLESVKDAESV